MPKITPGISTRNTRSTVATAFPALAGELGEQSRIGILVSGGCDSEVLLRAAADVFGSANTTAFCAITPFISAYYTEIVKATVKELNIKLIQVELNLLQISNITANRSQRCYYCKHAIYSAIKKSAQKQNIAVLADGTNLDDTAQYRPGMKAAEELNILHPFLDARMNKKDIRVLGRQLDMADPERPSDSCLATRISRNALITAEKLSLINKVEQPLRSRVKSRVRVRMSYNQLIIEYTKIDKMLVDAYREELQTIADGAGYTLAVHEIT